MRGATINNSDFRYPTLFGHNSLKYRQSDISDVKFDPATDPTITFAIAYHATEVVFSAMSPSLRQQSGTALSSRNLVSFVRLFPKINY